MEKKGMLVYFSSMEKLCDKVVSMFYDSENSYFTPTIVTKVEKLSFMQKLINSSILDKTQEFLKDKLESVPVVTGTLILFRVAINVLNLMIGLVKVFSYGWEYSLFYLMQFLVVFTTFIVAVGLITLKRRFAFSVIMITIILFVSTLILMFNVQIISFYSGMEVDFQFVNFFDVVFTLSIILFVGAYFFAVAMRNKKIFIN